MICRWWPGATVGLMLALAKRNVYVRWRCRPPVLFTRCRVATAQRRRMESRHAVDASGRALDRGDTDTAAKHFIDYWMGLSSWESAPESRKAPIRASVSERSPAGVTPY